MAAAGESSSSWVPLSLSRLRWQTLESLDVSSSVVAGCRALVRDPDVLLLPSHLPPDDVAVVKRVVIVRVLVFFVRAQAEVHDDSRQGRSGALPQRRTCHRQQ